MDATYCENCLESWAYRLGEVVYGSVREFYSYLDDVLLDHLLDNPPCMAHARTKDGWS